MPRPRERDLEGDGEKAFLPVKWEVCHRPHHGRRGRLADVFTRHFRVTQCEVYAFPCALWRKSQEAEATRTGLFVGSLALGTCDPGGSHKPFVGGSIPPAATSLPQAPMIPACGGKSSRKTTLPT